MKFKRLLSVVLAALFASSGAAVARGDEGMWTFNNVPRAEIKKRYGFDVTDAWLKKVQTASVRFNNGGSGSFVSPDGLVLTNHHVASDTLQKLSTPEHDYATDGFYAPSREQELKAPDLELNVLVSIEDVTARVNSSVKPSMTPSDANAARVAATTQIEKESLAATGLRSDVVPLYQGGQYHLYRYKKYTDVRLVFAPEFDAAFFGGDPDNFNFPRYCLDMTIFRVYENGRPLRVQSYFKWNTAGTKEGELVFVSGHPGSTARLNTVAHLEYLRDTGLPFSLRLLEWEHKFLTRYSALGEEQARRAKEELLNVENSLKAYRGQLEGLRAESLMARKVRAEEELRRAVEADPRMRKQYGDAWEMIAKGRKALPSYSREYSVLEREAGFNSVLFEMARKLVRMAAESSRDDAERLSEFTSARRASLELALFSPAPIYDDFEKMKLADSFEFMKEVLGEGSPLVKQVLKGKTAEARAAELVSGTKLTSVEYRKQLAAGGVKAIEQSDDPMIRLAREVDEQSRALRRRYESEVVANERGNYAKIARAVFDTRGTSVYPDATFTLRLSYGAVKGYEENGKQIKPYTTLGGLYERAARAGNKPPYQLPPRWAEKKSALNLGTPYNLVTTNDIIGGNSGSPLLNKNAELVGLIFDGNIQSLPGNFVYDEAQNRAISVDVRAMVEAMRNVYGAEALVNELIK